MGGASIYTSRTIRPLIWESVSGARFELKTRCERLSNMVAVEHMITVAQTGSLMAMVAF